MSRPADEAKLESKLATVRCVSTMVGCATEDDVDKGGALADCALADCALADGPLAGGALAGSGVAVRFISSAMLNLSTPPSTGRILLSLSSDVPPLGNGLCGTGLPAILPPLRKIDLPECPCAGSSTRDIKLAASRARIGVSSCSSFGTSSVKDPVSFLT